MKSDRALLGAIGLWLATLPAPASTFYVNLNNPNPTPPYADWSTAATNIQDAIDASSSGDQIWVTNGIYQTGGRVVSGSSTNRIALTKAVTVQSVNGPWVTIIQGGGMTTGTAAIRCAWLTNNAALVGFTLTWGRAAASAQAGDCGVIPQALWWPIASSSRTQQVCPAAAHTRELWIIV